MNSKTFAFLAVFLLCPFNLWAACTGSSPIWTTDGNEYDDVAECVSSASAGDTINVVAGDGFADWGANSVTIPGDKPLIIVGPGSANLTINLTATVDYYGAIVILPSATQTTQISGFRFVSPLDRKNRAIQAQGQGWRIHHNTYESIESSGSTTTGMFVFASGVNTSIQPYGLVDNNTVISGKVVVYGGGSFTNQSRCWMDPLELGSGSAVYIEDNTFTSAAGSTYKRMAVDSEYGGKYVFRYNTITNCDTMIHGLQADDDRGGRKWEIYGNSFSNTFYSASVMTNPKAGTGVIFYNQDISPNVSNQFTYTIEIMHERETADESRFPTAGPCDGSSPWDGNTQTNGYVCRDQVGTGIDASLWNGDASDKPTFPAPAQTMVPAYFWVNKLKNGTYPIAHVYGSAGTNHIQPDRDYYDYTESFNGTSGVGCGTLSSRPATCTVGVGYWVTNQSCSDLTSMVGKKPTTPINGTLYKCTAPNTWTAYYTPYTYPHPLRGGNHHILGSGPQFSIGSGATVTIQ